MPPASTDPATQQSRRAVDMPALLGFLTSIGSYAGPEMILSPERELFHYTDLAGLIGILQNGDLWLTDSRYSNDEEEMAHGERVAKSVVDEELAKPADPYRRDYLTRLKALIDRPAAQGVYICCFCRRDNLLSQWRGYGANGAGVSLQIESGGFGHLTGADCPHGQMRFWRVFYDGEKQRKIVNAAIDYCFQQRGAAPAEEVAQRAADAIQFFIPTFKNNDFHEEEEWRLIFTPHSPSTVKPRFRVRGTMLVPYYGLRDLSPAAVPGAASVPPKLPLRHVTVGPTVNKALNVASIRLLLDQLGYMQVPVEASTTPYRS